MEGYLTEPGAEKDHTDEFPVLSEEAILEMQRAAREPGSAADKSLAGTLETLLAAIAKVEKRWGSLESKLETYGRAIAELEGTGSPRGAKTLSATGANGAPATPGGQSSRRAPAAGAIESSQAHAPVQLLERIASLENYIAGRSDRWQEIEAELRAKTARIGELECELAERVTRERDLELRLAAEGTKAQDLRSQLQILSMKLRSKPLAVDSSEPGRVLELRPDLRLASSARAPESLDEPSGTYPDSPVALLRVGSEHDESYCIDKSPFTIGRSRDNDIRVEAESVSRRHAVIRRDGAGTFIEDQSSTNGVYVNGERVDSAELHPGDEITIGGNRFRFLVGAPN